MPQFQRRQAGQARVKILPRDATRAYMLMMKQSGAKLRALPNDVFECDESVVQVLRDHGIAFEDLTENEKKKSEENDDGQDK